jgi:glycosyltransferase involved in cell wall biosynthesis
MVNMKKIICIQRVLPEYRKHFFYELSKVCSLKILYGAGASIGAQKNAEIIDGLNARICSTLRFHLRAKKMDYFISFFPFLMLELLREKPDVIITEGSTNLPNNFIVYLYSLFKKTPVVWWDAGRDIKKKPGKLRAMMEYFLVLFQRRSKSIMSYTEMGRDYFIGNGIKPENIFVINNFSSVVIGADVHKRAIELRSSLDIKSGVKIFLCIGAIERRKMLRQFIEEASRSLVMKCSSVFVFVGDGPDRNYLSTRADELGLNCRFVGSIYEEKDAYYAMSDALVLPGWSTLAIVEALSMKKPVFTAEFGGPEHEFVIDGVTGCKHDPSNLKELIINLEKFISGSFSPDITRFDDFAFHGIEGMVEQTMCAVNNCFRSDVQKVV